MPNTVQTKSTKRSCGHGGQDQHIAGQCQDYLFDSKTRSLLAVLIRYNPNEFLRRIGNSNAVFGYEGFITLTADFKAYTEAHRSSYEPAIHSIAFEIQYSSGKDDQKVLKHLGQKRWTGNCSRLPGN